LHQNTLGPLGVKLPRKSCKLRRMSTILPFEAKTCGIERLFDLSKIPSWGRFALEAVSLLLPITNVVKRI
jgi:hypothetical protein